MPPLPSFSSDAVMGNRLADQSGEYSLVADAPRLPPRQLLGRHLQGGRFHETLVFSFVGEQRFHFPAQILIPATGFPQESRAFALFALQRGAVQLRHLLPSFRLHSASLHSSRALRRGTPWDALAAGKACSASITASALSSKTSPWGWRLGFSRAFPLVDSLWAHPDQGSPRRISRWNPGVPPLIYAIPLRGFSRSAGTMIHRSTSPPRAGRPGAQSDVRSALGRNHRATRATGHVNELRIIVARAQHPE